MATYKDKADAFMSELCNTSNKYPIKLSTMTILVTTTCASFLEKLVGAFNSPKIQAFVYDVTGDINNITLSPKRNAFLNSNLFTCKNIVTDHGTQLVKQSIKVFCNGNMHITGVKCVQDALYIADIFVTMIELVCGGTGISNMFQIIDFDVQLINYCYLDPFATKGYALCLNTLRECIERDGSYFCAYNTERHSGIIVKAPSFSVLIFASGNVILSSIKTPEQLEEAHNFTKELMSKHCEKCLLKLEVEIQTPDISSSNKKRKTTMNKFDYGKYLVLT